MRTRLRQLRRPLLAHLRSERGFALVMALGVLTVLTISGTAVLAYTSTSSRSSSFSAAGNQAYGAVQAGVSSALSVIFNSSNNPLNPYLFCAAGQSLPCPAKTITIGSGTATYQATLDQTVTPAVWHVSATGTQRNPTGARGSITRTQKVDVAVNPTITGTLSNQVWNYVYVYGTGAPSGCDYSQSNNSAMGSPLYVEGNACFLNSAWDNGELQVVGKLNLTGPQNKVGTDATHPDTNGVHIGGGCVSGATVHKPCTSADRVYANPGDDSTTSTIDPPAPNWSAWYQNASPGPYFACVTSSGSPSNTGSWATAFDGNQGSPTSPDPTKIDRSVPGTFNLTPTTAYSCKTPGGEISWDPTQNPKLLTIRGTIFIDGDARVDPGTGNATIRYTGQGALWLSGSFVIKNTNVCGAVSGSSCDWNLGAGHWDPNATFLEVVAGYKGGGVQSDVSASDVTIELQSAGFQGGMESMQRMDIGSSSTTMGPLVTSSLTMGQTLTTYVFPHIVTVPASTPDDPVQFAIPQTPYNYTS
jgi:Tfp pilus assembly protein PilX